jgi:hypothetical protein
VFDEQYGGAFTTPAGAVYREFQPAMHVLENLQPPPAAIIYKAIDFGFTNPLCCLWAAMDRDSRLLILREHYEREQNIDAHAETIRAIDDEFRNKGCAIGPAWADPSGPLEASMLQRAGLVCQRADNHVLGGIAAVRRMLAVRKDGKPGLYVNASCRNLVREFEHYRWEESSQPGERVPRKAQDHALDALRYLCVALQHRVDWNSTGTVW